MRLLVSILLLHAVVAYHDPPVDRRQVIMKYANKMIKMRQASRVWPLEQEKVIKMSYITAIRSETSELQDIARCSVIIKTSSSSEVSARFTECDLPGYEGGIKAEEIQWKLSLPFLFNYQAGNIGNVFFSSDDTQQSINFKKAFLGLLQVKMMRVIDDTNELYITDTETTIEGDCPVDYSTIKEGNNTYVHKTIDLDGCENRPFGTYGLRYMIPCNTCDNSGSYMKTRYDFTLKRNKLYKATVRSIHVIRAAKKDLLKTIIQAEIKVKKVEPLESEWEQPNVNERTSHTLEYSNGEEMLLEKSYTRVLENGNERKMKMSLDLIMNAENGKIRWSPIKEFLLHLAVDELNYITNNVFYRGTELQQYIFVRSLANAGSLTTVRHLVQLWENGKITQQRLMMMLKLVQETDYSSPQLINYLIKVTENNWKDKHYLYQSSWLAIGELIRAKYVSNDVGFGSAVRNEEEKAEFVERIIKKYNESTMTHEKILFLKVMGNTAMEEMLPTLERVLKNSKESFMVCAEAIGALRLIKDMVPEKIRSLLMPIVNKRAESPEIRMLCIVAILHTMPSKPVIQRLWWRIERDEDEDLKHFTWKAIESIGYSTLPCLQDFKKYLQIINRKEGNDWSSNSIYEHKSWRQRSVMDSGYSWDQYVITPRDVDYPVHKLCSYELAGTGSWLQYFVQFGYSWNKEDIGQDGKPNQIMAFMRYKSVDIIFGFFNWDTLNKLANDEPVPEMEKIITEMKLYFSHGPDIKYKTTFPTILGMTITHSNKVDGLVSNILKLKQHLPVESMASTRIGYLGTKPIYSNRETIKVEMEEFFTVRQ